MSYGTDTYCYDRPVTGRLATGVELLAQACYRRLTTPRGTLDDGEDGVVYGTDIADFVGRHDADLAPAAVEAELLKDDRIASVNASASVATAADGAVTVTLEIDVFPYDETTPFRLTLAASDVTVALLGVTPQ